MELKTICHRPCYIQSVEFQIFINSLEFNNSKYLRGNNISY